MALGNHLSNWRWGSGDRDEGVVAMPGFATENGNLMMYVRRLRSGLALAVMAVSVGVLALPMAAKAFQVMWPQQSAKVADMAAGLDHTFQALAVGPHGLKTGASSFTRPRHAPSIAVHASAGEPAVGQIFASVTAIGQAPLSLGSRWGESQDKGTEASDNQSKGRAMAASAASLALAAAS